MTALPKDQLPSQKMTVDEFIAWVATVPGRYELDGGDVVVMQSERVSHARVKAAVYRELRTALARSGRESGCEAFPDGLRVRISATSAFEPDAQVYCGPRLPGDATEVPDPVVVVEVTSPSTGFRDETIKVIGYFSKASIAHYLIINPVAPPHLHFARQADGNILTRIVSSGTIDLDPPGITISVDHLLD